MIVWLAGSLMVVGRMARGEDEAPHAAVAASGTEEAAPIEVHEWSVWSARGGSEQWNAPPRTGGAAWRLVEKAGQPAMSSRRDVVYPLSLLTFRGQPPARLDATLRMSAGSIVGHWPETRSGDRRLRWTELVLDDTGADRARLYYSQPEHWFRQARELDTLYVQTGSRTERFLAYDPQIPAAVPLALRGGPDEYQVTNLTSWPIYDVAICVPDGSRRRIGWIDQLPPAPPAAADPEPPTIAAELELLGHAGEVGALAATPDGRWIVSGGGDGTVRVWELSGSRQLMLLEGHRGPVRAVAFSPQGNQLATAGDDQTVILWALPGGEQLAALEGHKAPIRALAFVQNGERLASGASDGRVLTWSPQEAVQIGTPPTPHRDGVTALEAINQNQVGSAGREHQVKVLGFGREAAVSRQLFALRGHSAAVTCLVFEPVQSRLISAGEDGTLRAWDLRTRREVDKLEPGGSIRAMTAVRPQLVALGSAEPPSVTLWDLAGRRRVATLSGADSAVAALTATPDGRYVLAGLADGRILCWNVAPEALSGGTRGPEMSLTVSPPLEANDPAFVEASRGSLGRRLAAAGLEAGEIELLLRLYAQVFFAREELIVTCRLAPDAVAERIALDIFPEPRKLVRVALLAIENVDPAVNTEIERFVNDLGSPDYAQREAAERRLLELGAVAHAAVRAGLKRDDAEIVYRCERILFEQGQALDDQPARQTPPPRD